MQLRPPGLGTHPSILLSVLASVPGQVGWGDFCGRWLHAPDLPGVLCDGSVAGELARACNVPDNFLSPLPGVHEQLVHLALAFNVRFVVSKHLKPVVVHEHVDNVSEATRISWGEKPTADLIDSLPQLRYAVIVLPCVVPARGGGRDRLS